MRDESTGVVIALNKLVFVVCFFMPGLCLSVFLSVCLSPELSPLCIIYHLQYASALLVRSPSQILDLRRCNQVKYRFKKEFPLLVF